MEMISPLNKQQANNKKKQEKTRVKDKTPGNDS